METKEELLKPRYKQLNDWPFMGSKYSIGKIFTFDRDIDTDIILQYPHLFKPLQWWEERKPEDMPEYIKKTYDQMEVLKVTRYHEGHKNIAFHILNGQEEYESLQYYAPSTFEEYESYQSTKTTHP